ncbi:YihD family protein [Shewanella sp. YIC-542]|uniref:YihD family protein n=1 Tax=Shewanella mytili TaxID=3377111 RepID=UPI00398E8DB4
MTCHRIDELLALLNPAWQKSPDLSLMEMLGQLAQEAGYQQEMQHLPDDVLIYQLKMREADKTQPIPGLQKDYVEDFKTELLRARGMLDE